MLSLYALWKALINVPKFAGSWFTQSTQFCPAKIHLTQMLVQICSANVQTLPRRLLCSTLWSFLRLSGRCAEALNIPVGLLRLSKLPLGWYWLGTHSAVILRWWVKWLPSCSNLQFYLRPLAGRSLWDHTLHHILKQRPASTLQCRQCSAEQSTPQTIKSASRLVLPHE